MSQVLILIGYRGTGKTTVARLVAQSLNWSWIDADVELERQAGKSIADMFADEGERAFRDLESKVIAELCQRKETVIAAGGGVVLREENRRLLRESGRVVWLQTAPETIHQRITADASTAGRRPNLTTGGGLTEIQQLLEQRTPLYQQTADVQIDTDGRTPTEVAVAVSAWLENSQTPSESA